MRDLFLLLTLFILSCSPRKPEFVISMYENMPYRLWVEKDYNRYCPSKKENEIRIVFPLISNGIIENKYNRAKEVVSFSSECEADIISPTRNDLIKIPMEIRNYIDNGTFIATNIYNKNGKALNTNKYFKKIINNKKIIILSLIINESDITKPFYLSNYRIEEPAYEINRITTQNDFDYMILLMHSSKILYNSKKTREYFRNLFSKLTRKPSVIFTDIDKNIEIDGVKIVGYKDKITSFYFEKKFGFFKKITSSSFARSSQMKHMPETETIIDKTNLYFSKRLSVSKEPIPLKNQNKYPLAELISYAMFKFLRSDISIFNNDLVINPINSGDITVKDVYSIISNDAERFVYIKTRGEKIQPLLYQTIDTNSIYTQGKIITKDDIEKLKFQPQKIYRIITTESSIRGNVEILNYINEFSILNVKLMDGIMWYFRNHKIGIIKNE